LDHPVVQQVVRHVKLMGLRGQTQAVMQLHPNNLGAVEVRMSVKDGRVELELNVQNERVRGLIESTLPNLKDHLQFQNLELTNVSVNIQSENRQLSRETNERRARQNGRMGKDAGNEIDLKVAVERAGDTGRRIGTNTLELLA
jgi:flagellar hook-length control protein FliK